MASSRSAADPDAAPQAQKKGIKKEKQSPLIGTKPPEWTVGDWQNSEPLRQADLKGKVVLVRWWISEQCPSCSATAPALNEFHKTLKGKGLTVVGFYHHKTKDRLRIGKVRRIIKDYGFSFPVAIDHRWNTLKKWWLDLPGRRWTSVSFLPDRRGVIRYIHRGGKYVKGDEEYAALKAKIQELLEENPGKESKPAHRP